MYVCMCVQICVLNTIVFFSNNTYLEDPESLGSGSELNRNSLQKSLNLYAHRGKMTKTTFRTQYMQLLTAIFSHSMGPILDNSQGILVYVPPPLQAQPDACCTLSLPDPSPGPPVLQSPFFKAPWSFSIFLVLENKIKLRYSN